VEPYGAAGELVSTPAIQRLAEAGVSFRQGYATASVCSPTRYGLLTGRYSWRGRLQYGVVNAYDPLLIEAGLETLPWWLKERGYATAHIGKWHLGYTGERMKNLLGDLSPGPNAVGFDYHFGVPNNMDDLHKVYIENAGIYGLRSDEMSSYGKSYYGVSYAGYDAPQRDEPEIMEELTQRAVRWIEGQERAQPFFLYFCPVAVHHPILPSERMRGTSRAGAYGDFIQDLDYSLGELMAALERLGIADNTLVIFASDNGGDIPTDPSKPENLAIAAGLRINADLRGDKHTIYEGGLRVPFIVSLGKHLPGGSQTDAFITTADIFATVAELLEPEGGPKSVGMDSYSFARTLRDPSKQSLRTHAIFRDVSGRKAVRFGCWKLIDNYFPQEQARKGMIELFDLSKDPEEQRNVADQYPDIVEQGYSLLKRYTITAE
jgi:arylsulfatase A-like enzyme